MFHFRYVVCVIVMLTAAMDLVTRCVIGVAIEAMTLHTNGSQDSLKSYCLVEGMNVTTAATSTQPDLAPRYDWSQSIQGLILGAFNLTYILMQVPMGRLTELFGAKIIIAVH